MKYVAVIRIMPVLMLAAACGAAPQSEPPMQATAAIMTEVRPGAPLDEVLQLMDAHLVRALEGRLEGEALQDFRRAEAISDRLLETRMPFEWITSEQYSLEARLRQVQSLADRILAMVEIGASRDSIVADTELLRESVLRIRELIAQGGTPAPPHIHRLLQGGDTAGTAARREFIQQQGQPARPTGPRPLGQPIPPGGR
ncbi:MAG TPA: hypothetical protein VK929_05580 [Longimicrobiales bacterium]|nr:hypothetical protein [Longimicrobiales bacterium]